MQFLKIRRKEKENKNQEKQERKEREKKTEKRKLTIKGTITKKAEREGRTNEFHQSKPES